MTYQIIRIAKGKEEIIDQGPLTKMNSRLKALRASTRKGVCGRGGKYQVEFKIVQVKEDNYEAR